MELNTTLKEGRRKGDSSRSIFAFGHESPTGSVTAVKLLDLTHWP